MTEDEARGTTGGWRWPLGPIRILIIATAILSVVFLIIPQLDLWFSRQFYDSGIGFPAPRIPALQWLRDASGILLWVIGSVVVLSLLAKILVFPRRRPLVPGRAMLFLSTTLALSAGLLVNGILKSLWGRPRPTEVLEFGGDAPFVTAWHISDFCDRNCSFVSGESSAAIWLVAVALVVPARFRRAALATTLALATVISLNRIAFGGHFLSDVLLAWTLTLLIVAIAYHFLYVRPPRFLEEPAIDGALTRAGLWLRGLAARGRKAEPPLHPEAVAVLSGAAAPAHGHGHEVVPPAGYRAAGVGFAETAGPDEPPEPPEAADELPHAWPDDDHGVVATPGENLPRRDPTVSVFPEKAPPDARPAAAPDDARSDHDLDMAALEGALALPPAGSENIDSIDPEPEEAPPHEAALPDTAPSPAIVFPERAHAADLDVMATPPPPRAEPDDHATEPLPAPAASAEPATEPVATEEPAAADPGVTADRSEPSGPSDPDDGHGGGPDAGAGTPVVGTHATDEGASPVDTAGDDAEKPARLIELPPPDRV